MLINLTFRRVAHGKEGKRGDAAEQHVGSRDASSREFWVDGGDDHGASWGEENRTKNNREMRDFQHSSISPAEISVAGVSSCLHRYSNIAAEAKRQEETRIRRYRTVLN